MRKFKYLSIFILPLIVYVSFTSKGVWTWLPLIFTFGVIPGLELFFKPDKKNLSEQEKAVAKKDPFYDLLLFLIVPVQIAFLIFFLLVIQEENLSILEYFGRINAMGIMCGVFGINVGHELGHRVSQIEQFLGEILLLTSLEAHFLPYHNRGHHYNVATRDDPATARRGESLYVFWFRSQIGSYFQAWQLEADRLKKKNKNPFSFANRMVIYTFAQLLLLGSIYFIFGLQVTLAFVVAAIGGIVLLETVNYIEHYGLLRKQKENGRFERVLPKHSWNSDHILGRIFLFELSRHSDHHFRESKKYQILDTIEDSPQMPTGYPGMMILSMVPPLWFRVMDRKLGEEEAIS